MHATAKIIPLYGSRVSCGFPSPADDFLETKLDLNELIVKHPAATFYAIATGESMTGAGIFPGDKLVIDRSLEAQNRSVILAFINGEFTVKRLIKKGKDVILQSECPGYSPIKVTEEMDFQIWGVVTHVLHDLQVK